MTPDGFDSAWSALPAGFQRSLGQAYIALRAGGLPCGSALTDEDGTVVAEGRNRAYDPPGGMDALQGTPLAHAELNALAAARSPWDLTGFTLWSTQGPCAMCAAAATFTGVGTVRFLAPDPWATVAGVPSSSDSRTHGPADDEWLIAANLMFLKGFPWDHATVAGNRGPEPETVALLDEPLVGDTVAEALAPVWPRIRAAATARRARR